MTSYYVTIGNSDDRLSQAEWASFYALVNNHIEEAAHTVHGRWLSDPSSPWQNACWCIEPLDELHLDNLRSRLGLAAYTFRQDSIALACAEVEFITPSRLVLRYAPTDHDGAMDREAPGPEDI